jgi:hypothetical protein
MQLDLSGKYEIASKASMDLGDFPAVLDWGARSLLWLPEGPLLLIPLADIRAKQELFDQAARSARDALEEW